MRYKHRELPKEREKQVENAILEYLSYFRGGFVCKIELGGRPVKTESGATVMMPFKNKHFHTGMSDIIFLYKGTSFFFEVKTPEEHSWYIKNAEKLRKTPLELMKNKKHIRFKKQQTFIDRAKKTGNKGFFVSSVEQVQKIIKEFNESQNTKK